jgi:putative lipoprotein
MVATAAALMVALVSGMAMAQESSGFGVVSGTVGYMPRIALLSGAEVWVELADVSRADAPAKVIAAQLIIANGRQVPFEFALSYENASIDPRGRYTVSARILVDGALRWTSDTAYPVITNDEFTAEINVVQVAAPEVTTEETSTPFSGVVTGTVNYLQRIALAENAIVTVELQDTSRRDAPALVLASQQMLTNGRQVPFEFTLNYDTGSIDFNSRYSVRAKITVDDELMWTSDTANFVITNGVEDVELVLVAVG